MPLPEAMNELPQHDCCCLWQMRTGPRDRLSSRNYVLPVSPHCLQQWSPRDSGGSWGAAALDGKKLRQQQFLGTERGQRKKKSTPEKRWVILKYLNEEIALSLFRANGQGKISDVFLNRMIHPWHSNISEEPSQSWNPGFGLKTCSFLCVDSAVQRLSWLWNQELPGEREKRNRHSCAPELWG